MLMSRVQKPNMKLAVATVVVAVQLQLSVAVSASQVSNQRAAGSEVARWVQLLPEAAPEAVMTQRLLAGTAEGLTMLQAALVAGGVDDAALLRTHQARFDQWHRQLRQSKSVVGSPRDKAAAIFEFLHQEILTGPYEREATDLSLAFGDGRYNCVSSLMLYMALADRFELDVRAVEIPGHVFCRLYFEKNTLDIETTCATWFQSDCQRNDHDLPVSARGDRTVSAREIRPMQLLAIVYYNRAVELLARDEFRAAVSANLTALQLDPGNQVVRSNLMASINNWALALSRSGQHAAASDLLARGLIGAPHYPYFRKNDVHVQQRWIAELWNQGRYDRAVAVLKSAYQRRPGAIYLERAQAERLWRAAAGKR